MTPAPRGGLLGQGRLRRGSHVRLCTGGSVLPFPSRRSWKARHDADPHHPPGGRGTGVGRALVAPARGRRLRRLAPRAVAGPRGCRLRGRRADRRGDGGVARGRGGGRRRGRDPRGAVARAGAGRGGGDRGVEPGAGARRLPGGAARRAVRAAARGGVVRAARRRLRCDGRHVPRRDPRRAGGARRLGTQCHRRADHAAAARSGRFRGSRAAQRPRAEGLLADRLPRASHP